MKYKRCGHDSNDEIIIIDGELSTLGLWQTWKQTMGWAGTKELCFDCWLRMVNNIINQELPPKIQ